ncbi:MAG: phosphonate ABC transporter, permease protein PhnE [Chloroflexi bacterium]|nr:phosphonate ABC transporter, permease protein PhnE [Chloroflexota bacterium]
MASASAQTAGWRPADAGGWWRSAVKAGGLVALVALIGQAVVVAQARPQDLLTGFSGMADITRRSLPPDFSAFAPSLGATVETFDIGLLGTLAAVVLSVPLGALAARNVSPSPALYGGARGIIAITRAVPDLIWALFFVTAVGLGPFPGVLALSVHSIGMLGRLFAETIEDIDMGPVEALSVTGAGRLQIVSHAIIPGILPSLIGISLFRLDENVRSSLVLGFVGAGGIGFLILSYMNLFQYHKVAMLLVMTYVLVIAVERISSAIRKWVL